MAETNNTNVFNPVAKFVDINGLDYFWGKAKEYIDGVDASLGGRVSTLETLVKDENTGLVNRVTALETTVGDADKGLVKDVKALQDELSSLSGGAGSIQTQISNAIAGLDVDDAAVEGQYVSAVSEVDGKVVVSRAALPDYSNTYDAKGAAAQALADAKAYTDGKVDGKFDAAGSADAVQDNLDEHIANGTLHITAQERTDWNAAKTAIDTFLKDADMTESAVDTLKELQSYMNGDGEAAADLVNRVAALEAIDHNAYIAADEANLAAAKSYADGLKATIDGVIEENERVTSEALTDLDTRVTALEEADATNLAAAKAYADQVATAAKEAAIADAAAKLALKADAANVYTKTEVDTKITTAADAARDAAIADANEKLALKADKSSVYTKTEVDEALALKADKSSVYTKTEVDNLFTANSTADQEYARTYTDALFNSIKIASNAEIDAILA